MAPLGMERREETGTVFDMVIDRMDPVRVEHSLLDGGGGGGGTAGGGTAGGGQAGLAPTPPPPRGNRRWDATPAPAALAPPPAFPKP